MLSSQTPMEVSNLAVHPQSSHLVDQIPTLGPEPPLTLPITQPQRQCLPQRRCLINTRKPKHLARCESLQRHVLLPAVPVSALTAASTGHLIKPCRTLQLVSVHTVTNAGNYGTVENKQHPKSPPPRAPSESQNCIQPGLILIYFSCSIQAWEKKPEKGKKGIM